MPVAITNVASPAGVSASGNVATYSGVSIGVADNNRIVVLHVGSELAGASPDSATIDSGGGAVAMTPGALANQGAVYARCFYAHVPSGTTADFAVTFGANPNNTQNHIAVDRVVDANIVPASTGQVADTDADPISTGAVTIPTDGGMVAVCVDATDTTARTWTGLTESLDEDAGAFRFSTGISTTAGTPTITVSGGNNEDGAISWIIFNEGAQFAPSLYDDTDSFFAPTVAPGAVDIAPSLFDDAESFFAPTVASTYDVAPSVFNDADSFFAPTVDQVAGADDIAPSLYDDTDSFFAPTVSPGAVDVAPSLFDDADSFFTPTVSATVNVAPSLYDDADQFFAPTVSATYSVNLSLFDDTDTFFAPAVAPGAVDIAPSLYSDADQFFAPTVAPGAVDVAPLLYTDADQFLAPTVQISGQDTIFPSLYDDTDSFFVPTVSPGAVDIAPVLYSDAESFFAPTVSALSPLTPSIYNDDDLFFAPIFALTDQYIVPELFSDGDVFFQPTIALVGGSVARQVTLGVGRFGAGESRSTQSIELRPKSLLDVRPKQ